MLQQQLKMIISGSGCGNVVMIVKEVFLIAEGNVVIISVSKIDLSKYCYNIEMDHRILLVIIIIGTLMMITWTTSEVKLTSML